MELNNKQPQCTTHMEMQPVKDFNHTLHDLLKTLDKEQKPN